MRVQQRCERHFIDLTKTININACKGTSMQNTKATRESQVFQTGSDEGTLRSEIRERRVLFTKIWRLKNKTCNS